MSEPYEGFLEHMRFLAEDAKGKAEKADPSTKEGTLLRSWAGSFAASVRQLIAYAERLETKQTEMAAKGESLAHDLAGAKWTAHPEDINRPSANWMVVKDYFGEAHIVARGMGRTEALFVAYHDPATLLELYGSVTRREPSEAKEE